MVGKRQSDLEGDLFPRGAGPDATPRVRKRNGQVLFGPQLKRARPTRPEVVDGPTDAPQIIHGALLSYSRLSVGMIVLALVTQADHNGVQLTLSGGLRAVVPRTEVLVEKQKSVRGVNESGSESESESESEEEEEAVVPVWKTLNVGTVVRAAVVDLQANHAGKKSIVLSLKPHLFNVALNPHKLLVKGLTVYAAIKSVEDHGYILSFGSNIPHTGFLPFESNEEHHLPPGTPIVAVTTHTVKKSLKSKRAKIIKVTMRPEEVNACVTDTTDFSISDLQPGMLVRARVMQEGPGGVSLLINGVLPVGVDAAHTPRNSDGSWHVQVGKQTLVRILYVDAALKRIGGSLLQSMVETLKPRVVPEQWRIGTLMSKLRVEQVKPGFGLVLTFVNPEHGGNDGDEMDVDAVTANAADKEDKAKADDVSFHVPVFAHISRVSDSKNTKLESMFKKGQIITNGARVVSISEFDGMVNVDLRLSILNRKALSIDEVEQGSLYSCKIISHTSMGSIIVAVDGDPHIPGVIYPLHISDVPIPASRLSKHEAFRIGASLRCRVRVVKSERGKILLTARKSLVNPKHPILRSFQQAVKAVRAEKKNPGMKDNAFVGSVCKVTTKGNVIVEFCSGLVALVHPAEFSVDNGANLSRTDVEELYPVGLTVNVRLLNVDTENRYITASLRLKQVQEVKGNLNAGDLVSGYLDGWDADSEQFEVTLKQKESSSEKLQCVLPVRHLADSTGLVESLRKQLLSRLEDEESRKKARIKLSKAMVLVVRGDKPILTMKNSLIEAVETKSLPQCFEDVRTLFKALDCKEKLILKGYVKVLLPSGAIIGFCGDAVGFVRKSRIADKFVSDPSRFLKVNQSVHAMVESLDEERERFMLSMRVSDMGSNFLEEDTISLFRAARQWQDWLKISNAEDEFRIGSVMNATCTGATSYGEKYELKSEQSTIFGVSFSANDANSDVIMTDSKSSALSEGSQPAPEKKKRRKSSQKAKEEVRVRILDVDYFNGVADVSRNEQLVSAGQKKSVLSEGTNYSAEVLLVKSTYVILAVKRSKSKIAIAFAMVPSTQDQFLIRRGMKVSCKVLKAPPGFTKRNLVAVNWAAFSNVKHTPRNTEEEKSNVVEVIRSVAKEDHSAIVGMKVACRVTKVFPTHVHVAIAHGIVGRIHASNAGIVNMAELRKHGLGPCPEGVLSKFSLPEKGERIKAAYILGVRGNTDSENSSIALELSTVAEKSLAGNYSQGDVTVGFIRRLSSKQSNKSHEAASRTIVALGTNCVAACADVDLLLDDKAKLEVDQAVICEIIHVKSDPENSTQRIECALSENGKDTSSFKGIVEHVNPGYGLKVSIPWHARKSSKKSAAWGVVDICDVCSDYDRTEKIMNSIKVGDVVNVRNVQSKLKSGEKGDERISLTMRGLTDEHEDKDPLLTSKDAKSLEDGQSVRGFVRSVTKKGCFVSIGRNMYAYVKLHDLADEFVKDPKTDFPPGKVVSGKVQPGTSSENGKKCVSLVLRKRPRKKLNGAAVPTNLNEGSIVTGTVSRIDTFGALIGIAPGLKALLHKKEVDQDRFIHDTAREWVVGQKVTAIVIKVDGGKVQLGTKKCYFEAAGMDETTVEKTLAGNERNKAEAEVGKKVNDTDELQVVSQNTKDVEMADINGGHLGGNVEDAEDSGNEEEDDEESEEQETPTTSFAPLNVSSGFDFSDPTVPTGDESGNEDDAAEATNEEAGNVHKQSRDKRERRRQRQAAEKEIRLREQALAENADSPETAQDFERLLLGEPNSSVLWIRYMAFCLQLSQVDKARAIAERALETIDIEKEVERTNLWCAYVNLEAQYGSLNSIATTEKDERRTTGVLKLFERACHHITDVEAFHIQIAGALRTDFKDLAYEVLKRGMKKFRASTKMWIAAGHVRFLNGDVSEARKILEKALLCLERAKHVQVICKFAQFEYKMGSAERGRTVFESLVGNLAKRSDLWSIYLDMETSQCSKVKEHDEESVEACVERTRGIFERFVALKGNPKKVKFAFTKWLAFEKKFGTKETQTLVKNKAREYVEKVAEKTES